MPDIKREAIVPYTPAQMYDLVNDVERYPEFLPWCQESQILLQTEDEVRASLVISGGGFRKSFTTVNRLQRDKMIEIRLLDGPFKHLEGFWRFESTEEGCHIVLDLEFEFAGGFFDFAFGTVFNHVANSLVEAFCKRAHSLYGE